MSNQNWEKQEMEALFTVAEDIYRFDPWESNIAPFVLHDPHTPDLPVLVVLGEDDIGMRDIRFILGTNGMRNWLLEDGWNSLDEEDTIPNIEDIVNRFEGSYLEVGYNTPNLNNYEKRMNGNHHRPITFRRQRPGYGLASMVDAGEFVRLLRYLKALLKLLTRGMLGQEVDVVYHTDVLLSNNMLTAAAFQLTDEVPEPTAPFVLSRDTALTIAPAVLDEFSNARVKHLPSDGSNFELYYFYIPTLSTGGGALPRAFFLVDLDTGLLEWNDILIETDHWHEQLLRRLWHFFLEERGYRPDTIILQNSDAFCNLSSDIRRAGIHPEYMRYSYVGQELFESYLEASHIKEYQILANLVPNEPY